jgi:hypothetical protein
MGAMKKQWVPSATIERTLPRLAEVPGIDWSKPLNELSKAEMVSFLRAAIDLVREVEAATPFNDDLPF